MVFICIGRHQHSRPRPQQGQRPEQRQHRDSSLEPGRAKLKRDQVEITRRQGKLRVCHMNDSDSKETARHLP